MNPLLRIGVLAAVTTSVVLAGAAQATLGVTVASSQTTRTGVHELPTSTPQNVAIASLTAGTTYRASLVSPTPTVTPAVRSWHGAQFVTRRHGKVRYETAWLSWRDYSGREVDIVSGPAMTMSPAATIAQPRSRIANWNFDPYEPPGPVQRWTIAGRTALYFDATAPSPGEWSLVGTNPPELRVDHDHSFRMSALSVRRKTVVVVIQAPVASFTQFLPIATRLIASLRFPSS
jgi:hypothetical protein